MQKTKKTTTVKKRNGRLVFTGFSMGLADLVPGVSGGTIALLYGIYDELLFSIKQLSGKVPRLLFAREFRKAFATIPFPFLLPLGIGMLLAVFGLSSVVSYLLDNQPGYVFSLFFGLVIGSSVVISRRVNGWNINRYLSLVISAAIIYGIVGIAEQKIGNSTGAIFISGMLGFCAMILPGISGSLILVILGQYKNMINALNDKDFIFLITLAAGGAVGLALFSRLLSWLLKHHHGAVMAALVGMMLGSLRKLVPIDASTQGMIDPSNVAQLMLGLALLVAGVILVLRLEKLGIAEEHDDIDTKEFKKELSEQEGL